MSSHKNIQVVIDAAAMEQIRQWTSMAKGEFSCMGSVSDALCIEDVTLLKQVCSSSSTELDEEALTQWLTCHPAPDKIRAWIHSHGDMRVFWSAQDEETIEALANESFLISIVVNKRGEERCRLDIFHPVRLTLDPIPLQVQFHDPALAAQCRKDFDACVDEVSLADNGPMYSFPYNRACWGTEPEDSGPPDALTHPWRPQ